MSKVTVAAALVATALLGACSKHHKAEPVQPMPEPIYVEPVATTKY